MTEPLPSELEELLARLKAHDLLDDDYGRLYFIVLRELRGSRYIPGNRDE